MPYERQWEDSVAQQRPVRADLAGYGNQTALFATRLAKHYDLRISAFY